MMKNDIKEEYRGFILIVRVNKGEPKGRAIKDCPQKLPRFDLEGENFELILQELKNHVDIYIKDGVADWDSVENKPDLYIKGFQNILPKLSDGHLSMLKAHFNAPGKTITATKLAEAAGYKNYNAANMQYGYVGKYLHEEIFVPLKKRKDGTDIFTSALATGEANETTPEKQWKWTMKTEVADAIASLGLA